MAKRKQSGPGDFTLTLIDEQKATVDGRIFQPGQVTWREPPLPLMYLTENVGEGHKGSRVGGTITKIWRSGTKVLGQGTFETGESGQELRRLIDEGALNGVSSDVGGAIVEQELADDGTAQSRIVQGTIMGATVLPFPAFDDTRIAVVASAVPNEPPTEWFTNPNLTEATALTITREGHVFGHAALWNSCHIGKPNQCLTPPRSKSDYAYFKTGSVLTADGDTVASGPITLGTGHAGLSLGSQQAAEHYDHTGTAIADVVTGEDQLGIWISGAVRPNVPEERLRTLRASALSGDWRTINGRLELVALLAVNTPGFPVPRTRATFATENQPLALVAAGVATDQEVELAMKTDTSGGHMQAQPHTDQNDPTSMHNVTDETEYNAPGDPDSEPITEARAAKARAAVKEFAEEEPCTDCGDNEAEAISPAELTELSARLDAIEAGLLALARGRIDEFATEELGRSANGYRRASATGIAKSAKGQEKAGDAPKDPEHDNDEDD